MKKYLLSVCTVVLAISSSALTTHNFVKKAPKYWFYVTNNTNMLAAVNLSFPSSPPFAADTPPFGCYGTFHYCSLAFNNIVFDAGSNSYKPSNDGINALTPSQYDDAGTLQGIARKH